MDDFAARAVLVLLVIAAGGGVALWSRRNVAYHPLVDVAGIDLPPGVVVFTSTDCQRCKKVLALVQLMDVPLREITYELEAELQDRAGVTGVPLTIVVNHSGKVVAQFAGSFRPGSLRRAVTRAGW